MRATKQDIRAACHLHAVDSCSYCRNSAPTRNLPRVVRRRYHNSGSDRHLNGLAWTEAENRLRYCKMKPGLPPWGPHVRFRRVQTLVREGSPLVKLRNSA